MKFTTTTIKALALPDGVSDRTFFDDDLPCFGVRVRASGSKTFVVQYKIGAKHRRMPLGAVGAIDLSKARSNARDLLAAIRMGKDPAGEKFEERRKLSETFLALLPRFLARQRDRLRPKSYKQIERSLTKYAKPLHGLGVNTIDRRTIAFQLAEIEKIGAATAKIVRKHLSGYFAWLIGEGFIESNAVSHTNRISVAPPRDRVLTDEEIAKLWRALNNSDHCQYSAVVKLLLLTGCRRDEIANVCWSEIDFDRAVITLPPERVKNNREFVIPMTPAVVAILQAQPRRSNPDNTPRDFVFGIGSRGLQYWGIKKKFSKRAQIVDWRHHDFRRSMSTTMHERLDVEPHVVEACLGHVAGGVAGVYNQAKYVEKRRRALQKWADHLDAVIAGRKSASAVVIPYPAATHRSKP